MMTKKLCSSSNKINSLGKPSNRWKDIFVNKIILGDGDADSDVRLVADITGTETNPELKYNVTEQRWQVSHDGIEFNTLRNIYSGSELPNNEIGVNGDLWVVYSEAPDIQCSGPWSWVKLALIPGELSGMEITYVTVPFFDVSVGNVFEEEAQFIIDPVDGLGATGSVYASSAYPGDDAEYAFDGSQTTGWYTEEVDTPRVEWIAYNFDTPVSFDHAYILLNMNSASRYTAGAIFASNDSTNGEDGTWYTFRTDIFPMPDLASGKYMICVPLCTEDEIAWAPNNPILEY